MTGQLTQTSGTESESNTDKLSSTINMYDRTNIRFLKFWRIFEKCQKTIESSAVITEMPSRRTSLSPLPPYDAAKVVESSIPVEKKIYSGPQYPDEVMRIETDASYTQSRLEKSLTELVSMGPTSQVQWIRDNPKKHLDRFQHFIFHHLAVEYGLSHLASLSETDKLYFARVGIMYSFVDMYRTYHGEIGPNLGRDLEREVRRYYDLSIGMPSDILGIVNNSIILRVVLAHLSRYRDELLSRPQYYCERRLRLVSYSEELEKNSGEPYERKLREDLELVQLVVPYGNDEVKSVLECQIRAELQNKFPEA